MHLVLVDWSPSSFGSTEQLRGADCTAGGRVGGKRKVSRWIRRIDSGDGLVKDIRRSESGMSVGHWILAEPIGRRRDDQASRFIRHDESRRIRFLDLGPLCMVTCDCDQIASQIFAMDQTF